MVRGFNIECGCGLKEGQMVGYGKLFENFLLFGWMYFCFYEQRPHYVLFETPIESNSQ